MTTQQNASLFVLQSRDSEQQLTVDRELSMGRSPDSDIVLDQGGASRQHARLIPDPDGVWVEDTGSTNGTFVNDERIERPRLLRVGDHLQVGQSVFLLITEAPATEDDPDATLMFGVNADPDATQLHQGQHTSEASQPAEGPAPQADKKSSADPGPGVSDAKAPPSWVLDNQQSVDGTAFFSRDSIQESLRENAEKRLPRQSVGEPTLIGHSDPITGLRFQLIGEDKNQWEIGRSPTSDVMLNHESVSGAHAQIIHESGRWKVVDLMSANGTYINGNKCLTGYLSDDDVVCFGSVECVFTLPETSSPLTTGQAEKPASPEAPASSLRTAAIAFAITGAVAGVAMIVLLNFF